MPNPTVKKPAWLLPEGIEDLLPERAERVEHTRRALLDCLLARGYRLAMPPPITYSEQLGDLENLSFRTLDEQSGRMLYLCADITPQLARIDAQASCDQGPDADATPRRYCYTGPVFQTRPRHLLARRHSIQIGAELFGLNNTKADEEIILAMLEMLLTTNLQEAQININLGHAGVLAALLKDCQLSAEQFLELNLALAHKAGDGLEKAIKQARLAEPLAEQLCALPSLCGALKSLPQVREFAADRLPNAAVQAIDELQEIAEGISQVHPKLALSFDLSETQGFHYHTGITFTAYLPCVGHAIAYGGRCDGIGAAYGASRPATGFSADLIELAELGGEASK